MGISGSLRVFIAKRAKEKKIRHIKQHSFENLRGKSIAIDVNLYVHTIYHGQKLKAIKSIEYPYSEFDNAVYAEVSQIFVSRHNLFADIDCEVVYVFERVTKKVRDAKFNENVGRAKKYLVSLHRFNELELTHDITPDERAPNEVRDAYLGSKRPNSQFMMKLMALANSLGYRTVLANCEGERLCSMLMNNSIVDYVFSADSDCIAMGCRYAITDIDFPNRRITVMYLSRLLKAIELDYAKFLDLCIMCGCDFNKNIPNVGPKKAYDLITGTKNYSNLKSLVGSSIGTGKSRIDIDESSMECLNYELCLEMFDTSVDMESMMIECSDSFTEHLRRYS